MILCERLKSERERRLKGFFLASCTEAHSRVGETNIT
jgi:hypothetical protein